MHSRSPLDSVQFCDGDANEPIPFPKTPSSYLQINLPDAVTSVGEQCGMHSCVGM